MSIPSNYVLEQLIYEQERLMLQARILGAVHGLVFPRSQQLIVEVVG
jgi:hypothetical protein